MVKRVARQIPYLVTLLFASSHPGAVSAQQQAAVEQRGDSVVIRLVDVELRAAVQALSQYLDRALLIGAIGPQRVTVVPPSPVARSQVVVLLRSLLESNNHQLVTDSAGLYRVVPAEPRREPPRDVSMPGGPAGMPTPGSRAVELFVIRLRHARADDVAATVNALYGRAGAVGELGGRPSTLREQLQQNQLPPAGEPMPQAVPAIAGRAATLSGDVTIVPDARSNSLLVRSSRGDFQLIDAAVRELDIRPLQVLIEVLIAEVRRDRGFNLGVSATLPPTKVRGSDNTVISGRTQSVSLADFALRVMGIGGVDLDVTLSAAAARGDVRIVSRPIVLAANNESAEILVGSQRPFVQVARSLPTDAGVRDQVVQYKDVGTQLTVRPTISADGYVMLDVSQEVNAASSTVAPDAFNAPIISTRAVRTQLLIKDGQTVVLGGLSDRQQESSRGGVPGLSSIPLIGVLFGRASRQTVETELVLFLTPRVIRTDEEAEALSAPLRSRVPGRSLEAKPQP